MLSWFRSPRGVAPAPGAPHADAPSLLEHARALPAGERSQTFVRAADAAVEAGDAALAKRCLGEAIDDCLHAGRYDAAGALCRRLLALDPEVVRVRCTLAFLAIQKGDAAEVAREVEAYVRAAQRSGTHKYAIPRLHLMGRASTDPAVRLCLADALAELGDERAASVMRTRAGQAAARVIPQEGGEEHWRQLLRAAVMSSEPAVVPGGG